MTEQPIHFRDALPGDLDAVHALLARHGLPVAGVAEHFGRFVVGESDGRIVAAGGWEAYPGAPGVALLRSVVADPPGSGCGTQLMQELLRRARARHIATLWLLTTTATGFFGRFGFAASPRSDIPGGLGASAELTGACPATAQAMSLRLRA